MKEAAARPHLTILLPLPHSTRRPRHHLSRRSGASVDIEGFGLAPASH